MERSNVMATIDAYLLGERTDRAAVFAAVAGWPCDLDAARPIMRALVMVGAKAADESLVALRLILGGAAASDENVAALRRAARAAAGGDAAACATYATLTSPA